MNKGFAVTRTPPVEFSRRNLAMKIASLLG
jgi:hypothetical protein